MSEELKSAQIVYGENVLMMRVDDCLIFGNKDALRSLAEKLTELPSAEPERKKGKWVPVDSYTAFGGDEMTWLAHGNPIAYHYCSECKNHAYALEDGEDLLSDFCPNCGAEMSRGE